MNPSLTQLPLAFGLALVFFTVMTTTVAHRPSPTALRTRSDPRFR